MDFGKLNSEEVARFIGYKPNKWQKIVEGINARFKIICAGRRSGKSKYVIDSPDGALIDLLTENQYIWIVAPNYDLTQRVWVPLVKYARGAFSPIIKRIWDTKGNFRMDTHFGTTLEAKSAEEPQKLVGVGLTKLIIDEFNLVKDKTWFESLRPTLLGTIDKPDGKALFIGTPKGKNWGYDLWLNDLNPIDRPFGTNSSLTPQLNEEQLKTRKWASFRFTSFDNEFLLKKDLDELIKDMPEFEYRQEILAEFSETAEQVFRNIKRNIRDVYKAFNEDNSMGIDLGRKGAYSVICVVGRKSRHLKFMDRFRKISWEMQIGRIKKAIDEFKPRNVVVDATGIGDPVIEDLEKAINKKVTQFIFGDISKKQLVEKLALWVENGSLTYPTIPILFREMERYGRKLNPETGKYRYLPLGNVTTDCLMSLGLAIWPIKIYSNEPPQAFSFKYPKY